MSNVAIQWIPPDRLIPYAKNAKKHSDEQITSIAGQIAAFGFDQPIVVDSQMVIIKGHGRREAALRLGIETVPVIVRGDLDEYQAMAARIGDNKVAESTWDIDLLHFDVGTLSMQNFDMKLTGLSDEDLSGIMKAVDATDIFSEDRMESTKEKREDFENSDIRQIVLICDPPTFETMMGRFDTAMKEMGVETTIEVVQKLFEMYDENRPHPDT
jgi:hypothetical protein